MNDNTSPMHKAFDDAPATAPATALAQPDLGHMSGRERLHVFGGAKANPHAGANY